MQLPVGVLGEVSFYEVLTESLFIFIPAHMQCVYYASVFMSHYKTMP